MCALKVDLQTDEEVLLETDRAVLTNRRLLANLDRRSPETVTDQILLRDIASFKKSNGGQDSKLRQGLAALGAGVVLLLVSIVFNDLLTELVETLIFLAGALGILAGVYFTVSSLIRVKPNTTVLFNVVGSRDIPVYFPDRDNPKADEMTRLFTRAKRGL
jgi:hypothetical protein